MGDGAPSGRDSVAPAPRRRGRVGATLAVAHPATLSRPEGARSPIPNPARLRFLVRGGVPRPCGAPYRPERGHRETGMGDGAPYGRDSVAPVRSTARMSAFSRALRCRLGLGNRPIGIRSPGIGLVALDQCLKLILQFVWQRLDHLTGLFDVLHRFHLAPWLRSASPATPGASRRCLDATGRSVPGG